MGNLYTLLKMLYCIHIQQRPSGWYPGIISHNLSRQPVKIKVTKYCNLFLLYTGAAATAHTPQIHCLLGLYAMSMNCMEAAEAQFLRAIQVSIQILLKPKSLTWLDCSQSGSSYLAHIIIIMFCL